MTFLVALALLIGLLVVVPAIAHLLRRGRASDLPFAPTRLVPAREHVARQRSRLQDRGLLALRALIILGLALLGATPLVRCNRALLPRNNGASLAVMLVLDDSASMRNRLPDGSSRFSRAKRAALELADQLKDGDRMGLVLAGSPARVAFLPTTSPSQLRHQIAGAEESDRSTDLTTALSLSESVLDRQPELDKRIIVLSDLGAELPKPSPRVRRFLPELSVPADDCALLTAQQRRVDIAVDVACSPTASPRRAQLQLVTEEPTPRVLAEKQLSLRPGRDTFVLEQPEGQVKTAVRLLLQDDNPHDDRAPVTDVGLGPVVATYADPVTGRGITGGPPVLEQALRALHSNLAISPLPTVPQEARELTGVDLLLLDDPPLLSAEARAAITALVQRGGTAVAFFGPAAGGAQLGSLLLPFIERRATWESAAPAGLDPASISILGAAAASLAELSPKGRFLFESIEDQRVTVRGRWSDQRPFWIEAPVGRGLVVSLGLPSSIGQSDLALRSGFVAILDHLLREHEQRGTSRVAAVGRAWHFASDAQLSVEGPKGPVAVDDSLPMGQLDQIVIPTEIGRYRVTINGTNEERVALLPAAEVLEPARAWPLTEENVADKATGRLDISRWLAMALIPLLLLELVVSSPILSDLASRWRERWNRTRPKAAGD